MPSRATTSFLQRDFYETMMENIYVSMPSRANISTIGALLIAVMRTIPCQYPLGLASLSTPFDFFRTFVHALLTVPGAQSYAHLFTLC